MLLFGMAGLYALAPYLCMAIPAAGVHWPLGVMVTLLLVVLLSLACEYFNHAPLARKGASEGAHLISSLGISIVLVQVVAMIWGNETRTLRIGLNTTYAAGGVILTSAQLITAGVATTLLVAFLVLLRTSDIGLRLRALADNPTQFALFGYNVDRHRLLAFALSGLFVTAASLLTAYDLGFDPHGGLHAVLLAVVAVIIGGRGSFVGPIVGGLLLGLIRAQVVWHLSSRWQEALTFAVLAIFLLLRPRGLFGQKVRIEATQP